ncbi:MAG: sigma-54 dependent transcriptional regulator [Planctomycetia bacterium]|nr:sigma-54 dependent transcriptional regulator [Planctomycetia bacterium]
MAGKNILLVDDDQIILRSLSELLRLEGYQVETAMSFEEATGKLGAGTFQVVIADVSMPGVDGFELLKVIRNRYPDITVIMITGYGSISSAVEAIKHGAFDYLTKPIIDDEIKITVERALVQQSLIGENRLLKEQLRQRYGMDNILGQDYRMLKVFDLVEAVSNTNTTALITGESGVGKTMIARAIHQHSNRRDKPFIEVSCGALPETLLESELFGHVRGAFTGAVSDREGKFRSADGGTIFLDEISTASPGLQMKLLRVLEDLVFERVGGSETVKVDVRVILASNRDLMEEVKAGRFREDLYYRINVVAIHVPPLRERISDIPMLAEHFLSEICSRTDKVALGFSDEAKQMLQAYRWPGNVRELENCVERAVILSKEHIIQPEDFPATLHGDDEGETAGIQPLKRALEEPERKIIERALKINDWNRSLTAEALDINRTTLYKKIRKYELQYGRRSDDHSKPAA